MLALPFLRHFEIRPLIWLLLTRGPLQQGSQVLHDEFFRDCFARPRFSADENALIATSPIRFAVHLPHHISEGVVGDCIYVRRQRLLGLLFRLIPISLHGGLTVHAAQSLEGIEREQDGASVGVYLIPYVPVLQALHHGRFVKVREGDEIVRANWVAVLILRTVVGKDDIPVVQGRGRQRDGRGRGSAQVHLVESHDDVVSGACSEDEPAPALLFTTLLLLVEVDSIM